MPASFQVFAQEDPAVTIDSSFPISRLSRRQLLLALPAAGFAGLAGLFVWGLSRDPARLPSNLIGREVPEFSLPPVQGRTLDLSSSDLKGQVSLVNFFASWCVPCRLEHPFFLEISRKSIVPLHGINYKDTPENAAQWLNTLGDPYARTGADLEGRVGIDWGVYGIPETFVVGADGRIAHRHIGQLTRQALDETILPLVNRLQKDARGAKS
jgi:cytochrome c biogenesis protein CcmG, thiol:disulfide interchange protein DsbE